MNERGGPQPSVPTETMHKKLIPWLAGHGVTLAGEATENQIEAALTQLDARLENAALANQKPGKDGPLTTAESAAAEREAAIGV